MRRIINIFSAVIFLNSLPGGLNVCNSNQPTSGVSYSVSSVIFGDSLEDCGCNLTNTCIRKCCAENYSLQNQTCVFNDEKFQMFVYQNNEVIGDSSSYSIFSGLMPCGEKNGYYRLDPLFFPEDAFLLQNNGKLWQNIMDTFIERDQYCLESFDDIGVSALVCVPKKGARIAKGLNALGMIISMPFLLATFFVYAVLPDRNMHGKSLMCYVITLFGAYLLLVIIQLHSASLNDGACTTLGVLCLFFFMVSFFWMNVMSIDIWWTFSGMRGFSGSRKETERKRFLLYSAYAWGVPLLLAIVVTCLSTADLSDKWYNPGIGDGQCWFIEGIQTLLYFYLPMAILITANIVLFAKTALKIKQIQQDTAILRKDENKKHNYENDKQRFNLYLKLLLAMGINWSMEIISWLVDWQFGPAPPAVWYLTDFCNALYGVFIFFMFVFKKNIWNLLKRRYYMVVGKLHLARTVTESSQSPRTTTTSFCNS